MSVGKDIEEFLDGELAVAVAGQPAWDVPSRDEAVEAALAAAFEGAQNGDPRMVKIMLDYGLAPDGDLTGKYAGLTDEELIEELDRMRQTLLENAA